MTIWLLAKGNMPALNRLDFCKTPLLDLPEVALPFRLAQNNCFAGELMKRATRSVTLAAAAFAALGFGQTAIADESQTIPQQNLIDTGTGITLQEGFSATVFAEGLGRYSRHIAVNSNGDVYVASMDSKLGIHALRDTDGDGKADQFEHYENEASTEVAIYNGYLYFASNETVFRAKLDDNLVPKGEIETVIKNFPKQRSHSAKTFTFDNDGNIYVNIGAPSNACQEEARKAGSPGQSPCPQLELQAGIWKFDANKLDQSHGKDGTRYVTGVRNAMALDWNSKENALYFASHGRDQLDTLWPDVFNVDDNTEMPSEEFHRAADGDDAGWPYTFHDPRTNRRLVGPEYGGDGKTVAEAGKYKDPLIAFPAHWAPNDLVFNAGDSFPEYYHGGAFLAFQGSWNRAPNPQQGYNVVFIPFNEGKPTGTYQIFADGFKGTEDLKAARDAKYRPCGVAIGPDGALYISDIMQGRIWKITYSG